MHYFFLLLEIITIQMSFFFTNVVYFFSVNLILNFLLFSQRETMILFDEKQ